MPWGQRTAQAYADLGPQHHVEILLPELPKLLGEMSGLRALDFDYWSSGVAYDVILTPDDTDRRAVITDYHWTVSDYCNGLIDAGAALTRVVELPATRDEEGTPSGPPAYLAIRAERRT